MTRKEMSEIFAVLLLAYPNAETFKGGIAKLGPTISLWTKCLPEVDFWTGRQAVAKLVRECKFPPTIAEFREKAEQIQTEENRRIEEAWGVVRLGLKLGETPEEIAAEFPANSTIGNAIRTIGGPSALLAKREIAYGDGTRKIVVQYNFEAFAAAYRATIRRGNVVAAGQNIKTPSLQRPG